MRYLVVVLMIFLLPLRSWAGDSMALHMASNQIAIESGAASSHKAGATANFDHKKQAAHECHDVLFGESDSGKGQSNLSEIPQSEDSHCGTCQACQACHTVALLPPLFDVVNRLNSSQLRPSSSAFTSAAAALGQKPPIS